MQTRYFPVRSYTVLMPRQALEARIWSADREIDQLRSEIAEIKRHKRNLEQELEKQDVRSAVRDFLTLLGSDCGAKRADYLTAVYSSYYGGCARKAAVRGC